MAVQIQRRCGAADADAAPLAGLQCQRDDGFLVVRSHFQRVAVDHRAVVDQRGRRVVVVHVADASTHRRATVAGRHPLQGEAQVAGRVDRGDRGAGPYHRILGETARDLLARFVLGIERRRPGLPVGGRGGDVCIAGHTGAGGVPGAEIADHAAQCNRIRRALGRAVGGEQIRGIADQLLRGGQRILEFVKAAEVRLRCLQCTEIARQGDIRTQPDMRALQRGAASHQRGGFMLQVGDGDGTGQGECRAIIALALALDVAQRMVGDLRVDHLAVHHHVPAGVDLRATADRGVGRVATADIADRAPQPERRRGTRRAATGPAAGL